MLATPTSSARPSTAHAESEPCRAQHRHVARCPDRAVLNALICRGESSEMPMTGCPANGENAHVWRGWQHSVDDADMDILARTAANRRLVADFFDDLDQEQLDTASL